MHVSVHLVLGGVAGAMTGNPADGLAVGVASHVVLDALPHRDYSGFVGGAVDLLAALAVTAVLVATREPACVLLGALGGAFPDLEVLRRYFVPSYPLVFPSHSGAMPHGRTLRWWGSLLPVAAAAAGLLMLVFRVRPG